MAITLATFRAFVDGGIGDKKTVNVGNEAKTTLAQERFTGDRPLASRQIAQLVASQDNIYVRSQLLTAVRDALGGEEDACFRALEKKLFGISAKNPQADVKLASKPLSVREVKAALSVLDARLAQKTVISGFRDEMARAFSQDATGPKLSARNLELVTRLLEPQLARALAAKPTATVADLTAPGTAFALLLDRCKRSTANNAFLVRMQALKPEHVVPFLKACDVMQPRGTGAGIDIRLAEKVAELAKLSQFTPKKIFKIIHPDVAWPRDIPANIARLDNDRYGDLAQYLLRLAGGDMDARMNNPEGGLTPAEMRRLAKLMVSRNMMVDLGMSVADVRAALADTLKFNPNGIPRAAFQLGVQGRGDGVDEAFKQVVADLTRMSLSVSIPRPAGEPWTLPEAAMLTDHPFSAIARAQFRAAVEDFCGPRASETMKASIFLFMTQSAQNLDGVFNGFTQMNHASGTNGYHFAFAAEPDGSVVVTRTAPGKRCFGIEMAVRFHLDGTQDLVTPPQITLHPNVTPNEVDAENDRLQNARGPKADRELSRYVDKNLFAPLAEQFMPEIRALMTRYPETEGKTGAYLQRARNNIKLFVEAHADIVTTFLRQTPSARALTLPRLKAQMKAAIDRQLVRLAIQETVLSEALSELRTLAGTAAKDVVIDVVDLKNKMTYVKLEEYPTDEGLEQKFREIKARFLEKRTAVLTYVNGRKDLVADFRNELLREELERPVLDLEGLQKALAFSEGLVLPSAEAPMTPQTLKETIVGLARTMTANMATLDRAKYDGYQRGHMVSLGVSYLAKAKTAQLKHLLSVANEKILRDLADELSKELSEEDALHARQLALSFTEELA